MPAVAEGDILGLVQRSGRAGLHELAEARYGDMPAVSGLVAALLANAATMAPVLWIQETGLMRAHGRLSARGLEAMGGAPGQLLEVVAAKRRDALWAVEEGVRSSAVAAVVAELTEADFTATRRLSLATAATSVPALLLLPYDRSGATAAAGRWRVSAAPSTRNALDPEAPGQPCWTLEIQRAREAPWAVGRSFELIHDLEVENAAHALRVVDRLAARPAAPKPVWQTAEIQGTAGTSTEKLRRRA